jgi:hypothetical protein
MCLRNIYQTSGESILMDHDNILLQKYAILLYSCKKPWGVQSFNQHFPDHKYPVLCINTPGLSLT